MNLDYAVGNLETDDDWAGLAEVLGTPALTQNIIGQRAASLDHRQTLFRLFYPCLADNGLFGQEF